MNISIRTILAAVIGFAGIAIVTLAGDPTMKLVTALVVLGVMCYLSIKADALEPQIERLSHI